jgi:type IV pilus assembly protein PilV
MGVDMNNKYSHLRKNNSGAVLLEVLISILLFAFGVLGLVGMQTVATQNSVNSQDRAVASILANDMVSQMWAKKTSTIASAAISGDITAWKLKVQNSILSNATGDVTEVAGLATVVVTWKAPTKLSTDNVNKYETSVFVQ